jgi:hypothetical protein
VTKTEIEQVLPHIANDLLAIFCEANAPRSGIQGVLEPPYEAGGLERF